MFIVLGMYNFEGFIKIYYGQRSMQAKFLDLNEIQEYFEKENWKKNWIEFGKESCKEFGIGFCREL